MQFKISISSSFERISGKRFLLFTLSNSYGQFFYMAHYLISWEKLNFACTLKPLKVKLDEIHTRVVIGNDE
jgi:hypothetical protein